MNGRDAVDGWTSGGDGKAYLKVRVAVAPQEGQANAALIALLAERLDVPKSTVHIIRGETARLKTIAIVPAPPALAARLADIGDST